MLRLYCTEIYNLTIGTPNMSRLGTVQEYFSFLRFEMAYNYPQMTPKTHLPGI